MSKGWHAVLIGGVEQWISVRGANERDPVLLYLHGGPGASEYGPRRRYLSSLEERWRVIDWEQRGSGRSYRGDEDATTLTFAQLVDDGIEVVEWACRTLGAERLLLVGHSFGTALGVSIAQRVPARIAAYVGTGQVVDFATQETQSYEWALAKARRRNDRRATRALEKIGPPVEGSYAGGVPALETQRRVLAGLGGMGPSTSFLLRWFASVFTASDYPLRAKLQYSKAFRRNLELLWPSVGRDVDLLRDAVRLSVGVHLFHGRADQVTPLGLAERWFEALSAPVKRLEIVEGAGHLALFEKPEKFVAFVDTLRSIAG